MALCLLQFNIHEHFNFYDCQKSAAKEIIQQDYNVLSYQLKLTTARLKMGTAQ